MKKVLVITQNYAPHGSSLSVRISKITKYLSEFGWQPIILTTNSQTSTSIPIEIPKENIYKTINPEPIELLLNYLNKLRRKKRELNIKNNGNNLPSFQPSKYSFVKFLRDAYWYLFCFPDKGIWWYPGALRAAKKLVKKENINAIFSVAGNFSVHLVSLQLTKFFKIPWIADFDDPWDEGYYFNRIKPLFDLELKLHKNVTSQASAIMAVTEAETEILEKQFNKPVYLLPHGFDEDDFNFDMPQSTEFVITHTGILHDLRRNPYELFKAVKNLIVKNLIEENNFKLRFIGPDSYLLKNMVTEFGLEKIVELSGQIDYLETIKKQQESTILLLLGSMSTNRTCPLKLYEYFGAQKPILYLTRKKEIDQPEKIISRNEAGLTVRNHKEIENILIGWLKRFFENGKITPVLKESSRKELTWKKSAEILNNVLNTLLMQR